MPRGLHLNDEDLGSENLFTPSPEPQPMSSPSPTAARQVVNIPPRKKKFDPTEVITVSIEDGLLEPSYDCSQRCTYYFTQMNDPEGVCWKKVPQRTKDLYWGEFKKYITHEGFAEGDIKQAWKKKVAERYSDWMSAISKLETKPSRGISDSTWAEWKKYWKTDEFQEKSNRGKNNRNRNGKGMVNHTGGSQTFKVALKRMHARNEYPDPVEFHRLTHTFKKRPGVFCDDHASQVQAHYSMKEQEKLSQLQLQAEASGSPQPDHLSREEKTTLFKEAAGGEKRSGVYGSGSAASHFYTLERRGSFSSGRESSSAQEIVELRQQVVELKNIIAERDKVMNERVEKSENRMYAMFKKMMHNRQRDEEVSGDDD